MFETILIISFISTLLIAFQILKYFNIKNNSILRVKKYISDDTIKSENSKKTRKSYETGFRFISKRVGNFKVLDGYKKSIQVKLTRANLLVKSEEFLTISIILFLVLAFCCFIVTGNIFYSLVLGIVGLIIPNFILNSKIKNRIKYLNRQLGDAISLISNSLKAGYSFFQAVDIVAKEMTGPISEEFFTMQKEMNLGINTEKALENMINRVKSDDLELMVTAVLIQRQIGGNLAEVLDNISTTIRDRVKIKGDIKTLTAQGRMSGLVISLLPPILLLIIYIINPEHINLLFSEPVGLAMLGVSVVMELIGIFFINKIVKIEV